MCLPGLCSSTGDQTHGWCFIEEVTGAPDSLPLQYSPRPFLNHPGQVNFLSTFLIEKKKNLPISGAA